MKTFHFECACQHMGHTLRFILDDDEDLHGPDLYIDIYMDSYHPWWKRVWLAVKFVFGLQPSGYGHFGGWMMRQDHVDQLQEMINEYKEAAKCLQKP